MKKFLFVFLTIIPHINGMECLSKSNKQDKKGHTTALRSKFELAKAQNRGVENPDHCGCNENNCPASRKVKNAVFVYNTELNEQTITNLRQLSSHLRTTNNDLSEVYSKKTFKKKKQ